MTPDYMRTPDANFADLPDFPFLPHYLEWEGLRIHYLDEGPADGPVALLMHGEPTWSYLYRKVIPRLTAAGFRCIVPDYVGFGRSDKVIDDSWYVIERHCESMRYLIDALDLRDILLMVQDWGGPIGLRQAIDQPDRFSRLVLLNTWLHHDDYAYSDATRAWRDISTNPLWLFWVKGQFPAGPMMDMAVGKPMDFALLASGAAGARFSDAVSPIERAYEAPFTAGGISRAGPRRFPWLLPFAQPDDGNARDQARCFDALKRWNKPAHFIFGADDGAFTPAWGRRWASLVPQATFDEVVGAGHFVQEDAPGELVAILLSRIAA